MAKQIFSSLAAAVLILSGAARVQAEYIITDLGTLVGSSRYASSYATDINDAGQVVGTSSSSSGGEHAFLYSNGKMTDLYPQGVLGSQAVAINSSGQVVINVFGGYGFDHTQPYLYDGGKLTNLGNLGGSYALASGINNLGQVIGWSQTALGYKADAQGFLYSGGKMIGLSTGGDAINDAGQMVGTVGPSPSKVTAIFARQ
jgi:probable HAF family extracellular repeat protein